jgi:hypothetical protein
MIRTRAFDEKYGFRQDEATRRYPQTDVPEVRDRTRVSHRESPM